MYLILLNLYTRTWITIIRDTLMTGYKQIFSLTELFRIQLISKHLVYFVGI